MVDREVAAVGSGGEQTATRAGVPTEAWAPGVDKWPRAVPTVARTGACWAWTSVEVAPRALPAMGKIDC